MDDCPEEHFSIVKKRFYTLDRRLAHYLNVQITSGPLRTKLDEEVQIRNDTGALPLTGIKIVRMVIEHYKFTSSFQTHFDYMDLSKMVWYGDGADDIIAYIKDMRHLKRCLNT